MDDNEASRLHGNKVFCAAFLAGMLMSQAGGACRGGTVSSAQPTTAATPTPVAMGDGETVSNTNVSLKQPNDGAATTVSSNGTQAATPMQPKVVGPAATSEEGDGDYKIGPNFVADPNMEAIATVAQGSWCQFVVSGDASKFYTGLDANLNKVFKPISRKVSVYIPANGQTVAALPFMVGHDGDQSRGYFSHVLDNLIAKKAIPLMAAVCIDHGGGDSYGSERGLEYDRVSSFYSDFIEQEILPLVHSQCGVTLTTDPAGRGVLGTSSGGAAAISMGWFHPERYGRIVTYSATMVKVWPTPDVPEGAYAYPSRLFATTPAKNLRIFLAVGSNDLGAGSGGDFDWVAANRAAAAALAKANYHYQFYFADGAGHVDDKLIGQTLPSALQWVWRGYTAPEPSPKG